MELRIVVPHKGGIAHQKFGILRDIDNNKVCFSGSLNFTANALLRNLETIDCFTSWDIGNEGRIATYEDDFENVFSGKSSAVITYEPLALKEVIVANYPSREIDNLLKDEESEMAELVRRKYPREYACGGRIAAYIEQRYQAKLTGEEVLYLAIHIRRVTMQENEA